ncbi:MAG TPA: VPLPA-CTERM sorting domain-containing protein [Proteobacteria bacterium]|nr:VPLPA-CTERM sorting domain-containing protein [Pseudomonadota bacterium]
MADRFAAQGWWKKPPNNRKIMLFKFKDNLFNQEKRKRKMKKSVWLGLALAGLLILAGIPALAYDYSAIGVNITVFDGVGNGSTNWFGDQEDQEVEYSSQYNAVTGQDWDMEAFFWKNETSTLTMIGGYDLIDGKDGIKPGDVFLDVGSNGSWDYAISFSNTGTATWYALDASSTLIPTTHFPTSDPWKYASGATDSGSLNSLYTAFFSTDLAGVATGGNHNAIALDLSGLTLGTSFTVHFTMACGNDNLVGRVTHDTPNVPIPGAVWLLGSGFAGLVGLRRRRQN